MNYIKSGLKVLADYCISVIIFVVFLYMFLSVTKDNYSFWIPLYSFMNFLLLSFTLFSDIKKLAIKEKKPYYEIKTYPLKGFVIGLIGIIPIFLLQLIYPFIILNGDMLNRIKELTLKVIMGPVYFIVRLAGGTTLGYILATLIIPIITLLAYMAGYYGFEFRKNKAKPGTKEIKPGVKK